MLKVIAKVMTVLEDEVCKDNRSCSSSWMDWWPYNRLCWSASGFSYVRTHRRYPHQALTLANTVVLAF